MIDPKCTQLSNDFKTEHFEVQREMNYPINDLNNTRQHSYKENQRDHLKNIGKIIKYPILLERFTLSVDHICFSVLKY